MSRHASLIVAVAPFFVQCRSPTSVAKAPPDATPPTVDASVDSSTAAPSACEARNRHPAFEGCPHWRMAMPDACMAQEQPSFLDPCQCMCDLCTADTDCTTRKNGRCLAFSSVQMGGMEQRACVYDGDACHPESKGCPKGQHCYNYDGHPACSATPRN